MIENNQQRPILISSFSAFSAVAEAFRAPQMRRLWCQLSEHDRTRVDDAGTFLDRDELICADFGKRVFLPARPDNFNAYRLACFRFSQSKRQRQLAPPRRT